MGKLLFDSHAHINYERYTDEERVVLMDSIEASPVAYVVDVGFGMESSRQAIEDANARPWCYAAVGVHPHDADVFNGDCIRELKELLQEPKVVALGEIGLDFYRDYSSRDSQRKTFRDQLRLALESGMPIVIHDRESGGETLKILKEEGAFSNERKSAFRPNPDTGISDARVLMHCFAGSAEQVWEYIELGCTISIAGPVTYKNNKKTVRVVECCENDPEFKCLPLSHLLIETDAPYLTPEPFRGKPNVSPYVEYVARKIAELRNISYEEVAIATCENAKRFFEIDKRA